MGIKIYYKETRGLLCHDLKSKDNYWEFLYNMNLYGGAKHGCIYCENYVVSAGVSDISLSL